MEFHGAKPLLNVNGGMIQSTTISTIGPLASGSVRLVSSNWVDSENGLKGQFPYCHTIYLLLHRR